MMDIGRVCVKIAGKDAGKKVVVVDVLENNFVVIDGQAKRRRCNIMHLEPLNIVVTLKKNAPHTEVAKELGKLDIFVSESKAKAKKQRPQKQRSQKLTAARENVVKQ